MRSSGDRELVMRSWHQLVHESVVGLLVAAEVLEVAVTEGMDGIEK